MEKCFLWSFLHCSSQVIPFLPTTSCFSVSPLLWASGAALSGLWLGRDLGLWSVFDLFVLGQLSHPSIQMLVRGLGCHLLATWCPLSLHTWLLDGGRHFAVPGAHSWGQGGAAACGRGTTGVRLGRPLAPRSPLHPCPWHPPAPAPNPGCSCHLSRV